MHRLTIAACALTSMIFAGCSAYTPVTIDSTAVRETLAAPQMDAIRVEAGKLKNPILKPLEFDYGNGLSPDEAAVLAVLANPTLRAARDERGIAGAELIQAGVLPNPSLATNVDFPFSGPDNATAFGVGLTWDVASLISRNAKIAGAQAHAASVDLDVAWQEWQIAQAARTAVYARIALEEQVSIAKDVERRLNDNRDLAHKSLDMGQSTAVDFAAAEAACQEAHATVLGLERDLRKQKLALNALLGLSDDSDVKLEAGVKLPSRAEVPARAELLDGLEDRRLDLVALKRGYESQDAALRAAVLSRFPKIELGLNQARDTAKVFTVGPSLGIDLPIFDRNQGNVAIETATKKRLFDEYAARLFEARNDIAAALADIDAISAEIAANEAALPVLQRLVDTYAKALAGGHVDILSYYGAQNDLAKKAIELVALKQELVQARIALEIAAGRYLPEGADATTNAKEQR